MGVSSNTIIHLIYEVCAKQILTETNILETSLRKVQQRPLSKLMSNISRNKTRPWEKRRQILVDEEKSREREEERGREREREITEER